MRFRFVGIVSVLALGSLVGCSADTTAQPPVVDPDTGAADTGTAKDSAAPTDTGSEDTGSDEDTAIDSTVADSGAADTADTLPVDTSLPDTADTAVLDAADTAMIDAAETAVIDAADTDVVDATDSAMVDATSDVTDGGGETGVALPIAEVWVVRVGDGSAALSNASTAGFIQKFQLSTQTLLGTISLPTAAASSNQPLTFSGTATSEGMLARSGDGKFVTLGGYAVAPGTVSVKSLASSVVPRVIGRVNAAGTVDTSTTTTSHSGDNIRGAVTFDGSAYWSFGAVDGIQYIVHGATGMAGVGISAPIVNVRVATLFENGALWGTTGSGTIYRTFNFGTTARPTTATTPVAPTGMPITGSPYGIAGIATGVTTDIDTIYQCDDNSTAGGVLRYKNLGGVWGASVRLTDVTCRGLAVMKSGTTVIIVAVTGESASRVIVLLDTAVGVTAPTVTTLATAATNTQYRGPAFAPVP
jgi:hypothetical protein